MADLERRRRRPAVSCTLCRRRKIKCNRETPCSNCIRSGCESTCLIETFPSRASSGHSVLGAARTPGSEQSLKLPQSPASGYRTLLPGTQSTAGISPASHIPVSDAEALKHKIKQLEDQLARVTPRDTQSPASSSHATIETNDWIHRESRLFGEAETIPRGALHKARLFGQSHWIHGLLIHQDFWGIVEPALRDERSTVIAKFQRCKALGRIIKAQQDPPWPCPLSLDLPPRDVADELVDCYMRTVESTYRVLHIPSFRREYEALWTSNSKPNVPFLVQVKIVLAIGCTSYDDKFSLRNSAVRWIYEADTWLSNPKVKYRLGIQALQTHMLLWLAREVIDVAGDYVWVSVGELFRRAIIMGLHRDPKRMPRMTVFAAELRRRMWNTIMQMCLLSSLTAGGPPLTTEDDFDTEPPGNFNDDQLLEDSPVPRPDNEFTQSTFLIELRKTFPIRLAIVKLLNDFNSQSTYEDTLRLDAELRGAYKAISQSFQVRRTAIEGVPPLEPSRFVLRVMDVIMHRYLSALHVPFLKRAMQETAFAFSRKAVLDSSLKLWYAECPPNSFTTATSPQSVPSTAGNDDILRMAVSGSEFWRTVGMQAVLLIAMELKAQLEEEDSLEPTPLRPDLLAVLASAQEMVFRTIEVGETNVKGYLVVSMVYAEIQALMRRVDRDEMPSILVKAAEDAEERCIKLLEETAAERRADSHPDGVQDTFSTPPSDGVEDWDFLLSDMLLNPVNLEPMTWVFDQDVMQ